MQSPLRYAHVYLSESRPAIVAPMHFNSAGIYYEQEEVFVDDSVGWCALSALLRSALDRYSFREANLREGKKTDWPSYKASHCRSVRQFEELYLRIAICAVNNAELFYDASCQPRCENDISLHIMLNPYAKGNEMDNLLKKLFKASLRWVPNTDQDS